MRFVELPSAVDPGLPLIYLWEIRRPGGELVGRYVGKAKGGAGRPRRHYARNVRNVLAGRPYRKGKPAQFRRIHLALAEAERLGHHVTLAFLCNVGSHENINEIEQLHIQLQNSAGPGSWQLNGPAPSGNNDAACPPAYP